MKNMKKIIGMLLSIAMVMSLFTPVSFAETTVVASGYWGVKANGQGTGNADINTVPETILSSNFKWFLDSEGTLSFEAVNPEDASQIANANSADPAWLDYKAQVKKVIFPDGVTQIGGRYFESSAALQEVIMPDSVTSASLALWWNNGLKNIKFSNNLEKVGYRMFLYSTIPTLKFPASVESFATNALEAMNITEELEINGGAVETNAVNRANGLTMKTLKLYGNTTVLADDAIQNMTELTTLIIGDGVVMDSDSLVFGTTSKVFNEANLKVYGKGAGFEAIKANGIKKIKADGTYEYVKLADSQFEEFDGVGTYGPLSWTANNKVLTITGTGAMPEGTAPWAGLSDKVRTVVIEEGVTSVSADAFANMTSIKNVLLPSTLTSIGAGAFSGNTKLAAIVIPDAVTTIGEGAFDATTAVCVGTASSFAGAEGYKVKTAGVDNDTTLESNGRQSWAVYGNEILVISGTGSSNNANVPWGAYHESITTILLNYGLNQLNTSMFSKSKIPADIATRDSGYPNVTTYIMGDSITEIRPEEISGFDPGKLTRWDTPYSLTSIGHFITNQQVCAIKEFFVPKGVVSYSTATGLFNFNSLESFIIEEGFNGFTEDIWTGEWDGFIKGFNVDELVIPNSVTKITNYTFNRGTIDKLIIKNKDTEIAENAFNICNISSVECAKGSKAEAWATAKGIPVVAYVAKGELSNGMNWLIDGEAGNYSLTITGEGAMPDFVTAPWQAYAEGITSVELDNRITSIGAYTFVGFAALNGMDISANIAAIADNAFVGMKDGFKLNCATTFAVDFAEAQGFAYTIGGNIGAVNEEDVTWTIDTETLTMTISGNGAIQGAHWSNSEPIPKNPWRSFDIFGQIETIIVEEGVTYIPGGAFNIASGLKTIILPDSLTGMGQNALNESDNLEFIEIPVGINDSGLGVDHFGTATEIKRIAWLDTGKALTNINGSSRRNHWTYYVQPGSTAASQDISEFRDVSREIIKANGKIDGTMIEWLVTEEGTLDIYGMGDMAAITTAPWADYAADIENVYIEEGITGVGANLFSGINGYIELPGSVTALSAGAFAGCGGRIRVPFETETIAAGAFGADSTIISYPTAAATQYAKANNVNLDERQGLRILTIGNSYTEDATVNHLWQVAEAMGVEELKIGNLMYPGRNIQGVYNHIINGDEDYLYREITSGGRVVPKGKAGQSNNILVGIKADEWDVITIQPWFHDATYGLNGIDDGEESAAWLDYVVNYVKENATNPNVKLAFNLVWAQQSKFSGTDRTPSDDGNRLHDNNRPNYGNTMDNYNKLVAQMNEHAKDIFDYILPSGTVIENARTSFLGGLRGTTDRFAIIGGVQRDGTHINNIGMYAVDMAWVKTLLPGTSIDNITWAPAYKYTNGPLNGQPVFTDDVIAECKWAAKAALETAAAGTYAVTQSENPFKILAYADNKVTIAAGNTVRRVGYSNEEMTIGDDGLTSDLTKNGEYVDNNDIEAKVIVAEYDDGKLVNCKVVDHTLTFDEVYGEIESTDSNSVSNTKFMTYDKSIANITGFTPAEGNTVKVMLWDGYENLAPLADALVK